jgi:hypothetical protein
VDSVNNFGLLVQKLTMSHNRPSAVCGISLYQLFLMAGGGGQCEDFYHAMGISPEDADEAARRIMQLDGYCKAASAFQLSTTRSLWHQADEEPATGWPPQLTDTLDVTIEELDPDAVADLVMADADHGLGSTRWMLLTCFSFSAEWAEPFSIHATRTAVFQTFDDEVRACAMMRRTAVMDYNADARMQVCVLPYRADDADDAGDGDDADHAGPGSGPGTGPRPRWRAALVLPVGADFAALAAVQARLSSPTALRALLSPATARRPGLRPRAVDLALPRLNLWLGLDLRDAVGVADASARMHQAVVLNVNEFGTDMPEVASVEPQRTAATLTPRHRFVADRPFLFLVFDDTTKTVLCSAAVCEPTCNPAAPAPELIDPDDWVYD